VFNSLGGGVPVGRSLWNFQWMSTECQGTYKAVEILPIIWTAWVGCTSVTNDRQTDDRRTGNSITFAKNCIGLRQLLQNRKLRHLWRHNLGSRWKLQKNRPREFSIVAFYNITKNQHNRTKTVGWDRLLSPKTPKNTCFSGVTQPQGVAQPLYSRGHN